MFQLPSRMLAIHPNPKLLNGHRMTALGKRRRLLERLAWVDRWPSAFPADHLRSSHSAFGHYRQRSLAPLNA